MKLKPLLALAVSALLAGSLYAGSNRSPQAEFTYVPGGPTTNDIITFDGSGSSDPDGKIVQYEWDFNGDGAYERASDSPRYNWVYDSAGSYSVALRVTDNGGATAVGTREIMVSAAPIAAPIAVWQIIAAPIPPDKALPGDWIRVMVEISFRERVVGPALKVELPDGWRIREVENGAFLFHASELVWVFANEASFGDRLRIVYEVQVPGNASRGLYKIGGFVSSFAPRFKIPIPKDVEVQVL